MLRGPNAPRRRALRGFGRGLVQAGPKSGGEPELRPDTQNLAHLLRARGYEVAYKGKWHLTHPSGDSDLLGGWAQSDAERLRDQYGFADWEPPDAGENAKAEHFGAGNAGPLGLGWDEVYTRQVESWLGRQDLPEPFCLVVSLVNPHDVLGYPAQHVRGGYPAEGFLDLGVKLPPTVDENLRDKPAVHELMRMGMAAYLGPLRSERERLEYVNFYAHLHRVVDENVGRVMAALGDPSDPGSLRSRTVIFRCADHGEMGLSHGGLRQKAFNAYEETIHVPLVVSNPVLFPKPAHTDALASLVDVLPTVASMAGAQLDGQAKGRDLSPILAGRAAPEADRLRRTDIDLAPITAEITYGLERIAMFLSKVRSVFDVMWNESLTYGEVRHAEEVELSRYGFEIADVEMVSLMFDRCEAEAGRALEAGLILPAYEATLVCSHQFNLLDARGAVSATDRVGLIRRVRDLACACARAYLARGEGAARAVSQPEPAAV